MTRCVRIQLAKLHLGWGAEKWDNMVFTDELFSAKGMFLFPESGDLKGSCNDIPSTVLIHNLGYSFIFA